MAQKDSLINSAILPYIVPQKSLYELPGFKKDTGVYYFDVTKKLFGDNLIVLDKKDLYVTIDPILHIEIGREFRDDSDYADTAKHFINTRGFNLRGSIGRKLSFETYFSENQIFVPLYQRERIADTRVAPGGTIVKPFETNGFDFGYAGGFISFQATKKWNVQMGHGKHFIGDGYRSVILSDNSSPYPYFRSSVNLFRDKIQFSSLFAILQNLNRLPLGESPESLYERKSFSLNSISFTPIKQLRIGFHEGVIWQTFVPEEGDLPFSAYWINPLPLFNMIKNEWDDTDNLFFAIDWAFKPVNQLTVYSQYLIDDPNTKRESWQFGCKIAEPIDGLWLRIEYNSSKHFTGAHTLPLQGITHNNLPLAHPLGAGYNEYVGQVSYKWKRWFCDVSIQRAKTDPNLNLSPEDNLNSGTDLLLPFPGMMAEPSSFFEATINAGYYRIGYQFNSFYNFMAYFAYQHRNFDTFPNLSNRNGLLSFGLKTELFNHYYDF